MCAQHGLAPTRRFGQCANPGVTIKGPILPIVSIVVPFFGLTHFLLGTQKGTTMETIGILVVGGRHVLREGLVKVQGSRFRIHAFRVVAAVVDGRGG